MCKLFHRIFLLLFFAISFLPCQSQDSLSAEKPEMAGLMRSNGKIYVVVAVLLIILSGILIYLVSLDKKISRLEKTGGGSKM